MKLAAAPATPLALKPDVGGRLHGGCAGYGLAKSYPITKCLIIEPSLLFNGHLADIRNYSGPAKRGRTQSKKGKEEAS